MPESGRPLRTLPAFLALVWTAASIRHAGGAGSEQQIPLSVVKLWASAFGGEIRSIAAKYSGSQLLQKDTDDVTQLGNEISASKQPTSESTKDSTVQT